MCTTLYYPVTEVKGSILSTLCVLLQGSKSTGSENQLALVLYNPYNQSSLYKICLLCQSYFQIFTNDYNSSILRSPADSKITRCAPLFQRKSQVECQSASW